ncbi:restriction endonuclease [Paractinoplanes atraurantiacus]|uniref:Restriction endonuclease n=1 Tax=Paractinoplanes atraurantiacus TaxID=1036182 RepID=A0A285IZK3_9ACTN|nr:restriction endonuclease [Actinoplanes atraurantiacus]SNY53479.1 Restriction endonuclease [Actinoplanes atraurantiacus]
MTTSPSPSTNTTDANGLRLVAGIFLIILMVSHLTIGKIGNPVSYVLDVAVFGGGGLMLIRWWHLRRVVMRSGSGAKLAGPPGVALLPAFIGTFFAFAAVDTVLDSLWEGSFAGHWGLIIWTGLIGAVLLAISAGLARDFARGKIPPPKQPKRAAARSAPAAPLTPVPMTPASPPSPAYPSPAGPSPSAPALAVPAPPPSVPAHAGPPPAVASGSPAPPMAAQEMAAPQMPARPAAAPVKAEPVALPPADLLRTDARTAWAYRRYLGQRRPGGIDTAMGERLLSALEPGDHVELILDAVAGRGDSVLRAVDWERPGLAPIVAVRTLRAWILLHREGAGVTVAPGRVAGGMSATSAPRLSWPHAGRAAQLTATDGASLTVKFFLDEHHGVDATIFEEGAGEHIRRIPESADVPAIPDGAALLAAAPPLPAAQLPTDWRAAEDIACAHMRMLGFADAETTAGGRDGGLDVVAEQAIAQVKMLALPVGAPPVQQLRGTRPLLAYHLFYSTSGYTSAALAAADEIGVALFKIERDGTVAGANAAADGLEVSGGTAPAVSPKRLVELYAEELAARVLAALKTVDHDRAELAERYPGQYLRLARYAKQALDNLQNRPGTFESLRSALVYYHHTELLVHVFFQELGIPYPEGDGAAVEDSLDSYYD